MSASALPRRQGVRQVCSKPRWKGFHATVPRRTRAASPKGFSALAQLSTNTIHVFTQDLAPYPALQKQIVQTRSELLTKLQETKTHSAWGQIHQQLNEKKLIQKRLLLKEPQKIKEFKVTQQLWGQGFAALLRKLKILVPKTNVCNTMSCTVRCKCIQEPSQCHEKTVIVSSISKPLQHIFFHMQNFV